MTIEKELLTLASCPMQYFWIPSISLLLVLTFLWKNRKIKKVKEVLHNSFQIETRDVIKCLASVVSPNVFLHWWLRTTEAQKTAFGLVLFHVATTSTHSISFSVPERFSRRENVWFRIFEISGCGVQNSRICKFKSRFLLLELLTSKV